MYLNEIQKQNAYVCLEFKVTNKKLKELYIYNLHYMYVQVFMYKCLKLIPILIKIFVV